MCIDPVQRTTIAPHARGPAQRLDLYPFAIGRPQAACVASVPAAAQPDAAHFFLTAWQTRRVSLMFEGLYLGSK
jgi:hypothetical protein